MKKLLILLTVLTFVSCSDSNNSITNPEKKDTKGSVAITFQRAKVKSQTTLAKTQSTIKDFPDPTNVRVLIRRFEDDNLKFNALADVKVPTDTTVMIQVPAKNNYQIDAFSYIDSTSNLKPILKIDQESDISVVADEVTNVTLKLKPVSATFIIPDTVKKGDNFSITANFDGIFNGPIGNNTQHIAYIQPDSLYQNSFNSDNSDYYDNYSNRFDAEAPDFEWDAISISDFDNRYAYFQITSKIATKEFYQNDENQYSFILNYPNPYISDTLKTFVKTPEGGIGIGIQY